MQTQSKLDCVCKTQHENPLAPACPEKFSLARHSCSGKWREKGGRGELLIDPASITYLKGKHKKQCKFSNTVDKIGGPMYFIKQTANAL